MPSSKGEPTDPELREKIKEEVKNMEKGKPPLQLDIPFNEIVAWLEIYLSFFSGGLSCARRQSPLYMSATVTAWIRSP